MRLNHVPQNAVKMKCARVAAGEGRAAAEGEGNGEKGASLVGADRKKQMVLGSVDSLPGPKRFTSDSNNKVKHKAFLSWGLLGKHTKKKKQR